MRAVIEHLLFVYHHHHTILAVATLRAVEPHRVCIGDHNGIGRDETHGFTCGYRLETTVDACVICEHGDRHARLVETRLCHCMITSSELELDHVSLRSLDIVGAKGESTALFC